ncbi:MAG: LPXTG cell wall anchor domain-containing protein [Lachnospiraceae bacterium]|nr:LPXTG cell wall anchor domain-containing protein [Lachnospiraceae bacterium]
MKRMNKRNRMVAFLAAVILTVFGLCQAAFAADTNTTNNANIDIDRPVSLSIKLVKEDGETDTAKTSTVKLYQVGKWDGSQGKYVLTDEFAASGISLEGETGDAILKEIDSLQTFIGSNGISPLAEGRTQSGQYTFADLSMGLYMVCSPTDAQAITKGDNTVITPFLITLPLWVKNENAPGEWRYDVEASPKHGAPEDNDNNGGGNGGNNGGGGGNSGGGGGRRGNIIDPEGTPTAMIDDGGTPLEGLTPPSEQINDEEVPLGNSITQLIEDVLVPLGLLPKTGDGSISYAPLLALMAASGLLIFGLIWRRVRKADS